MGISAGGGGRGAKADINVTPLVDIVLVLLIIFLVTTPIMMRQITVEVPRKLQEDEDPTAASKHLNVLIKADGTAVISVGADEQTVNQLELAQKLKPKIAQRVTEKVVFVDFECSVTYNDVVFAMDTIKGVGTETVALKIKEEKDDCAHQDF
jgi:biopolymer transport protein ExbD